MKNFISFLWCSLLLALSFSNASIAKDLLSQSQKETAQDLLEEALQSDLGFSMSRCRSIPFFVRQETRAMCVRLRHACAAIED